MRADDVEELLGCLEGISEELKGVVRGILVEAVGRLPRPRVRSALNYSVYMEFDADAGRAWLAVYELDSSICSARLYAITCGDVDIIGMDLRKIDPKDVVSRIERIIEALGLLGSAFMDHPTDRT